MGDEKVYTQTPLPSGVSADSITTFMENARLKNKVSQAKSLVDNFDPLLKVTIQFGMISNDSLTEIGKEYAFGNDEEKRKVIRKIISNYQPYNDFLIYNKSKNGLENPTDKEAAELYWSREGFGSNERNRSDAVGLFFGLLELANLGKYYIGRRGGKTRIEWNKDEVEKLFASPPIEEITDLQKEKEPILPELPREKEKVEQDEHCDYNKPTPPVSTPAVTVSLSVNIGEVKEWDMSKIKKFFRYLYGDFNEDEEN